MEASYWGLFFACFLAATLLPFASEGILVGYLLAGFHPITCLVAATAGNSLGGLTNYGIGRLGNPAWLKRLGTNEERLLRFQSKVERYGHWMGLLSWVPVIGDPLTVALGYFRTSFLPFLLLMVLGKLIRYWVIIFLLTSN